jgi:hypothetical protein
MAESKSINPAATSNRTGSVVDAIQSFSCEVEYIYHLAETLHDHAASGGDMRSEALAHAIMRVSESVGNAMTTRLEKAMKVSHG